MNVFTDAQAAHALDVVLWLMKKKRFFLYQKEDSRTFNPDYTLDPAVFGPALELNSNVRAAYRSARIEAETRIQKAERELGFVEPDLTNKQLVQCNRYSGGLDICRVYPLTEFLQYAPESLESLIKQCLEQLLNGAVEEDIAPKEFRKHQDDARCVAKEIWRQLKVMNRKPGKPRCVVMMQTRFSCEGSDENFDFMQSRVREMQQFPHAMGYLFCRYSKHARLVPHDHVVFSTSRRSHVNVQHWSSGELTIEYSKEDGYTCRVVFVAVF